MSTYYCQAQGLITLALTAFTVTNPRRIYGVSDQVRCYGCLGNEQ
jgi:hypothetical protein